MAGERQRRYTHQRMNKQTSNNSQVRGEQVANPPYQSIKLGLDVHADSIRVVRILDGATPQPAQRFKPAEFLSWAAKQLGLARQVFSCYEAGPFGYGLHRQLTQRGVHNYVVRPLALNDFGNRVNTDKTDALALALRLDRYVNGNKKALALVRVPTPLEEQQRVESRQRQQLKREHKRLAAQGRSLLLSQGWREKGAWWKASRWSRLERELPGWLKERLGVFRTLLATVQTLLDQATRTLAAAAPQSLPRGLGGLTFETLTREVGTWARFANRKQIGSYTGLCAGVSSSGLWTRMLPITKHGNPRLRAALMELAWRLLRWQSQCRAVQKWKSRLLDPKASAGTRKKAIVALARQLAIDLWRWQTGRASPQELGWQMNG